MAKSSLMSPGPEITARPLPSRGPQEGDTNNGHRIPILRGFPKSGEAHNSHINPTV